MLRLKEGIHTLRIVGYNLRYEKCNFNVFTYVFLNDFYSHIVFFLQKKSSCRPLHYGRMHRQSPGKNINFFHGFITFFRASKALVYSHETVTLIYLKLLQALRHECQGLVNWYQTQPSNQTGSLQGPSSTLPLKGSEF